MSLLLSRASRSMLLVGVFVLECGVGEVMYASRLLSRKEGMVICEGGILDSMIGVEGGCYVGFSLSWTVLLFFSPVGALFLVGGVGVGCSLSES